MKKHDYFDWQENSGYSGQCKCKCTGKKTDENAVTDSESLDNVKHEEKLSDERMNTGD